MKKEDLSPEQLEAFTAAMAESRGNIRNIIFCGLVSMVALQAVNFYICTNFLPDETGRFVVYFLTTVLVASSTNNELMEEATRFQEESQKILDNKL